MYCLQNPNVRGKPLVILHGRSVFVIITKCSISFCYKLIGFPYSNIITHTHYCPKKGAEPLRHWNKMVATVPLYIHRTCKRVLGVELFSNRCFRPSFSSLSNAKHILRFNNMVYIVEPQKVCWYSPDIEVTSESAVPPPLSVASHPGWRLCLPQAVGQLKVHCLV